MLVSPATEIGCLSLESVGRKDRVRLSFVSEPSERNNEVAAMHIPHELQDEFPDEVTLITQLRKNNYLFMRLTRRYDEVNGQIYRIESEEEPTTDEVLERLKKERLKLKDQIAGMLIRTERRM